MFKTIICRALVVCTFMSGLFAMEQDNCPKFTTDKDLQDFLHQLGTTAKSNGQGTTKFDFQDKTWLIQDDSYAMLNGSIPSENEDIISKETTDDYIHLDELQFVRQENAGQTTTSAPNTKCYYQAAGTGRKNGQMTTINNDFYLTQADSAQGGTGDETVKTTSVDIPNSDGIKTVTTTLGAEVQINSKKEVTYQWDTFYQTTAYQEAEVGEEVTDNFIVNAGSQQLLVRVQVKKGNSLDESRKRQVQVTNKIKAVNLIDGKPAGIIYVQNNGQESYYAGFWRDHQKYKDLLAGQKVMERFNIQKMCGLVNGQTICVINVSDVVIRRAAKEWQLPIFDTIVNHQGAKQAMIIPNKIPQVIIKGNQT